MIEGKKVLAVIPARGGSKGVPRKNIRQVAGKPLLAWTVAQARRSRYIDRLILSSDDAEIMAVARQWGCEVPFARPAELAKDDTPGIAPVLHALEQCPGYDVVVLLQPTSPLREAADIDRCLERVAAGARACVTVTAPEKSPYWMYRADDAGRMIPLLEAPPVYTRQALPKVVALNGAVYAAETQWLRQTQVFVTAETVCCEMPRERSLDIDTENDLRYLEFLLATQPGGEGE